MRDGSLKPGRRQIGSATKISLWTKPGKMIPLKRAGEIGRYVLDVMVVAFLAACRQAVYTSINFNVEPRQEKEAG